MKPRILLMVLLMVIPATLALALTDAQKQQVREAVEATIPEQFSSLVDDTELEKAISTSVTNVQNLLSRCDFGPNSVSDDLSTICSNRNNAKINAAFDRCNDGSGNLFTTYFDEFLDEQSKICGQRTPNDIKKILDKVIADMFKILLQNIPLEELKFYVCDDETKFMQDKVTVCGSYGNIIPSLKFAVTSTPTLKRSNAKPLNFLSWELTFLYSESLPNEPKEVKILHTINVNENPEFPLSAFSQNFVGGQELMLILKDLEPEFYLLSYPKEMDRFATENLTLTHIPTGQVFQAENYPGTTWWIFNFPHSQKRIAVGSFGDVFKIEELDLYETPAAYVIPWDLSKMYEVAFSKFQPVRIINPTGVGELTVCQSDNDRDQQVALICLEDKSQFTLSVNQIETRTINGNEYAFIFEIKEGVKQVSIFDLYHLSNTNTELVYNDFVNSMVEGRRLAVEFEDDLYLISHPGRQTISLPTIIRGGKSPLTGLLMPSSAVGSEGLVDFPSLKGGKLFLQRQYGTPPPPFLIKALSRDELEPVNLKEQLSTTLYSTSSLFFEEPKWGEVTTRDDDNQLSDSLFKIGNEKTLDLVKGVPQKIEGALFYYHTANLEQGVRTKTASIYLLYTLSTPNKKTHPYTDESMQTFISGKQLVLEYPENKFYLLEHRTLQSAAFFNLNKFVLKELLNPTSTYSPQMKYSPDGSIKATFAIPDGTISITTNEVSNQMFFEAKETEALPEGEVEFKSENYSLKLTPRNQIKFTGDTTVRMCFKEAYSSYPSAKLCFGEGTADPLLVDLVTSREIDGTTYLFESNERTGDAKIVTIRKVIPIDAGATFGGDYFYWTGFAKRVREEGQPVFNISGKLYLPRANNNLLADFAFVPYPAGALISGTNLNEKTPVTYNATFVLDDRIVIIEQEETDVEKDPISAAFTVPDYYYLPTDHTPIIINSSDGVTVLSFVTKLEGKVYTLEQDDIVQKKLVQLTLEDNSDKKLVQKYFAQGDQRTVYLDNVPVDIEVVDIEDGDATFTVRRG